MHEIVKDYYNKSYYLAHHGIKGQKWGVRNGPPYPLGESDKSTSETKTGGTSSGSKSAINLNEISQDDWDKLYWGNKDFVLANKTKLYETVLSEDKKDTKDTGKKFVFARKADIDREEYTSNIDKGFNYKIKEYESTKELKVAGRSAQSKIALRLGIDMDKYEDDRYMKELSKRGYDAFTDTSGIQRLSGDEVAIGIIKSEDSVKRLQTIKDFE